MERLFLLCVNLKDETNMGEKCVGARTIVKGSEERKRCCAVSTPVAYPRILLGGGSTNSVEDRGLRERGSGGGSPLVMGFGGSCNLVQEISFHIVKFS